jgi:membrane protein DedA with SNARE-associated domain
MRTTVDFLLRHGYAVLFVWVFFEQLGLPIPSIPLLLAAGALAGTGKLSLTLVILLPLAAALSSDVLWFEVGRRRGRGVLNWLCRISLEPDSCVRRTEDVYLRRGARSLLLAKFIPGLNAMAPPLAGIFKMSPARFLLFDGTGALLWIGAFTGLGFIFSDQLEDVADHAARLGISLLVLLLGALAGYIAWKYWERRRFMRGLRIARIAPDDLKRELDAGEEFQVIDLRHSLDFEADPSTIPGALHMDPQELEERQTEILRDRDIILYCT